MLCQEPGGAQTCQGVPCVCHHRPPSQPKMTLIIPEILQKKLTLRGPLLGRTMLCQEPICIYSPNSLCCRGSGGVSSVLDIDPSAFDAHAVAKSCAQARQTVMVTSLPCTRNHSPPSLLCAGAYDMTHSDSKMSLASWVPPGASWVPPGCSWVPPGCLLGLLGVSWMSPT